LKKEEVEAHLRKLQKWKVQREALSEQIKIKNQISHEEKAKESPIENPHARSESLMVLYKKEKAKQMYDEQMQIRKQKKIYEAKVAEIDRERSLERLITARKEYFFITLTFSRLEKDLKTMKISKFQQRKALEGYWKNQIGSKVTDF
jgi:hypothetical protein